MQDVPVYSVNADGTCRLMTSIFVDDGVWSISGYGLGVRVMAGGLA